MFIVAADTVNFARSNIGSIEVVNEHYIASVSNFLKYLAKRLFSLCKITINCYLWQFIVLLLINNKTETIYCYLKIFIVFTQVQSE